MGKRLVGFLLSLVMILALSGIASALPGAGVIGGGNITPLNPPGANSFSIVLEVEVD